MMIHNDSQFEFLKCVRKNHRVEETKMIANDSLLASFHLKVDLNINYHKTGLHLKIIVKPREQEHEDLV